MEEFASFITENPLDADSIYQKSKELDIRSDKALTVLAQVVFDSTILKQIPSKSSLLKPFLKTEKDQKGLLGGLERVIGISFPELIPKTPLILKAFYDLDLLEESVLLAWSEKISKKYVEKKIAVQIHEKANPFIQWLKEAEEEEDE